MSIESLSRRLDRMREQVDMRRTARSWVINLEEGQELPEACYAHVGPYDQIVIQEYPRNFFGKDECNRSLYMSCWVQGPRGHVKPLIVQLT